MKLLRSSVLKNVLDFCQSIYQPQKIVANGSLVHPTEARPTRNISDSMDEVSP